MSDQQKRGRQRTLSEEDLKRIEELRAAGKNAFEVHTLTGLPKNPVYLHFSYLAGLERGRAQ